jgi:hypothetical protein
MSSKKKKNNHVKIIEFTKDDEDFNDENNFNENETNIHEENIRLFDERSKRLDNVLKNIRKFLYDNAIDLANNLTFSDLYDFVYSND